MRKLGEQWVEEIDGKKHMLKAVGPFDLCQGCLFNCNQGGCCWKGFDTCLMGNYFIIIDLGVLNEDGLLTCPFCGEYPTVAPDEYGGWTVFCDGDSHSTMFGSFLTKQEAMDEANRRA